MADVDVHYDPITINTDAVTVDVKGLDDTHLTLATPQPLSTKSDLNINQKLDSTLKSQNSLETDSKFALAITEPIVSQSTAELDLKPIALDQCVRISFGPLPSTCVRQPYHQHFGFTLFGMEIFGFSVAGESQVLVTDIPTKPKVTLVGEQAVNHQHSYEYAHDVQPATGRSSSSSDGLIIRLEE